MRSPRDIRLKAPYLMRVWIDSGRIKNGGATLLGLDRGGLRPTALRETAHFKLLREFWADPESFVKATLET
jgi:hypothetical protein